MEKFDFWDFIPNYVSAIFLDGNGDGYYARGDAATKFIAAHGAKAYCDLMVDVLQRSPDVKIMGELGLIFRPNNKENGK